MKNMKKFLSIMMAFVMMMTMSVTAFAGPDDEAGTEGGTEVTTDPAGGNTQNDGEGTGTEGGNAGGETATVTYDHPLKITGLAKDDVAHFYQVVEWVGEEDGNVAGWKATTAFASVLTKEELTKVLLGTKTAKQADVDAGKAKKVGDLFEPTGITSELAGKLAKAASGTSIDVTVTGTEAKLDNPAAGLYMALITPADVNTVYNPVFVGADFNKENSGDWAVTDAKSYTDESAAKKSTLTLTKTAATTEDNWDDKQSNTTAVGDTVNFTVNTTIPGYGNVYTEPHFAVKDTLTALKLNKDSVTVTVPEGLTKGTQYTVEANDNGYTITFTADYLKTLSVATAVTVTYDAIVTSDAEKAINEEDNEVYIEYSHDPKNQSDYDVKKDTTQHYTFTIDAEGAGEGQTVSGKKTSELVKVGLDAAKNPVTDIIETSAITSTETWKSPLAGAVFGLFTDDKATVPYKAKNATDGTAGTTPMTATTGADGRLSFAGLDAGTYYLKEISAPAGYVTNTTIHTIVIAAETESVKVTEWWNGTAWVSEKPASGTAKEVTYDTEILKSYTVTIDGKGTAKYTFTNQATANSTDIKWENAELVEHPFELENTQGTELPSTGGIGTTIFYTVGAILVLGAGIVLVSKRRMDAE